jgi:predicted DNA-binding WGR domain protein
MSLTIDPVALEVVPTATIHNDFSATLNQVDIKNNANKFYIVQVLKDDQNKFHVWTRYGRVGAKGTYKVMSLLEAPAIREFKRLFASKTGNIWSQKFVPKSGKYTLMQLDPPKEESKSDDEDTDECDLPTRVQTILKELCSKKMIKKTLVSLNVDPKKMPLGKISKQQIEQAHTCLKKIEAELGNNDTLTELSSNFWTLIPRASKLNVKLPIIDNKKLIEELAELLEVMANLQVVGKTLTKSTSLTTLYESMGITLDPLDEGSHEYKLLSKAILNGHAPTHQYQLEVVDILKVNKLATVEEHKIFSEMGNHKLLFHGSRTVNWMGILTEGFRIPLPSQVTNGSVLGYGIYFADSVSKSFNYCCVDADGIGYIIVCEVALGEPHIVYGPSYHPPKDKDSRLAKGSSQPDPNYKQALQGALLEVGKIVPSHLPSGVSTSFLYNEYVIYRSEQYRFRYLLKLRKK